MNKYYLLLGKVLAEGKTQQNKKGKIKYLLNEQLTLTPADLLDIFESHGIARKKLKEELSFLCRVSVAWNDTVSRHLVVGLLWSDIGEQLPDLHGEVASAHQALNKEKRNSKNYVLFLGATDAESNQAPC